MIALNSPTVPIPDSVAGLIGACMPTAVLQAEVDAVDAAITVSRCRTPFTREARELALSELALNNKILAAYNPRLIVTSRGAA
ncbi:hypothetical protein ABT010_13130 [Streptomyces sp. NPDC002668]|uniref:hypothetical protein n=1 Tax=Streptomyces sp. NPDC002668 TaxID=3154422 RepID=UPI00332597D4